MISEKATSYLIQCSKILQSELSNQYNVVDEISINLKDIHELRDILNELRKMAIYIVLFISPFKAMNLSIINADLK